MNRDGRSTLAVRCACLLAAAGSLLGAGAVEAGETLAERRARIESMDPAEIAELRRAQEHFAGLDPSEQARLRDLHEKIESHPQSEELWSTVQRYCEWVQTLSQTERADLRDLPPAERIKRMKEIREQREKRKSRWAEGRAEFIKKQFPPQASDEEIEAFLHWIDGYVTRKGIRLVEGLPEPHRQRVEQALVEAEDDPTRRREILGFVWLRQQSPQGGKLPRMDEADLKQLESELPESARKWLSEKDADSRSALVARLIGVQIMSRYAFGFSGGPPPVVGDQELAKHLEKEISPEMRDWLLARPGDEQRRALWLHYMRSRWPGEIPGWPQGPPGSPGRMRGPGGLYPHRGGPSPADGFGSGGRGRAMPGGPRRQFPGRPPQAPEPPERAPENPSPPSRSQ